MGMELGNAYEFLRDTLSADATIEGLVGERIYEGAAPEEATYPLIVVGFQNPEDVTASNAVRCCVTVDALVRAVGKGEEVDDLETIEGRIDALLDGNPGDGTVLVCTRVAPIRASGYENKIYFKNLGGVYRLEIGV